MSESTDVGTEQDLSSDSTISNISNNEVYDLLADTRRRYTLHYLKQSDGPVEVRDLAEKIAAWENDKSTAELTSQERKRVYISLYQSHLSTLDDEGIVDYNEDDGLVELSDEFRDLDVYLEVVPERTIPWSHYYLGLSLAGIITTVLMYINYSIFSELPELQVTGVLLLLFAGSAVVQLFQQGRMRLGDEGPPPALRSRN